MDYDPSPFKAKKKIKDKSDRQTIQKVLDPKTEKILNKLIQREKLFSLSGSISTGKEANIYTCQIQADLASKFVVLTNNSVIPAAIKIYQTSVMEFKNREKYIENESRFQSFCKSNPRKLIKLWAEKEVRNLKRLNKNNILAPFPIYLKNNVLIMSLIGTQENVAKKLKDAFISNLENTYKECLMILNRMYNEANLIHSDFSEYNLLYHEEKVFVIDVGQSIEKDHPNAFSFLIMDIRNITNFFRKKGVSVKNINESFEEITGIKIPHCLRDIELNTNAFIPQRLDDIANLEDMDCFFKENNESNEEMSLSNENNKDNPKIKKEIKLTKEEKKTFLKENKKKVKENNRIKRLTKIPKKEKIKAKKLKDKRKKK